MKIKPLLMATALALSGFAATSSYATNYVVPMTGPIDSVFGPVYASSFGATVVGAGAFSDTFTFTPSVSGFSYSTIISNLLKSTGITFTDVSINGNPFTLTNTLGVSSGVSGVVSLTGPLILAVLGTSTGPVGTYSGNFAIAAIPEPETYAMMLAGLGLVGFMARRRRKTESKETLPQLSAC
jgi:hypothetical protein